MSKYLLLFLIFTGSLFSENINPNENKIADEPISVENYNPNIDCLILEDENSVICKFEVIRDLEEQIVTINWINPIGEISRTREMTIPAGDVSAYDYRYVDGREEGKWNFKILYKNIEYSSEFELKK